MSAPTRRSPSARRSRFPSRRARRRLGSGELHNALIEALPKPDPDEEEDEDAPRPGGRPTRRPSSGGPTPASRRRSTPCSARSGCSSAPRPASPRDSISLDWEWQGRRIKLHDTAGMRRRARIDDKLEKLAVSDGLRAVRFAEVVGDAAGCHHSFREAGSHHRRSVESEGRALVIGLNKWDLVADQPGLLKQLREDCTRLLPQVRGVAVVPLSGIARTGCRQADAGGVTRAAEVWDRRVLHLAHQRLAGRCLSRNPPPAVSGRRIKIRYATQVKSRPPQFAPVRQPARRPAEILHPLPV